MNIIVIIVINIIFIIVIVHFPDNLSAHNQICSSSNRLVGFSRRAPPSYESNSVAIEDSVCFLSYSVLDINVPFVLSCR